MNDIKNIIEKVKKLQSLANNNSNLNEALAATKAADKLIQEYRISQVQLQQNNKPTEDIIVKKVHEGGRRTAWRETLLWALTKAYNCSWFLFSQRIEGKGESYYKVVGYSDDVDIVDYLFNDICNRLEALGKIYSRNQGVGYGVAWLNGASCGVREQFENRIKEEQEQAKNNTNLSQALVVLNNKADDAKNKMYEFTGKTRTAKSIGGIRDFNGFSNGREVGRNLSISKALK